MPDTFSESEKEWLKNLIKIGRENSRGAARDAVEEVADRIDPLLVPRTRMEEIAESVVIERLRRLGLDATTAKEGETRDRVTRALKLPEVLWSIGKWVAVTVAGALIVAYAAAIIPVVHH